MPLKMGEILFIKLYRVKSLSSSRKEEIETRRGHHKWWKSSQKALRDRGQNRDRRDQ